MLIYYICVVNTVLFSQCFKSTLMWTGAMTQLANPVLASTGIPCGHWFVSKLLHFPNNSLLVAWGSSGGWLRSLDLCFPPVCEAQKNLLAPSFRLTQFWPLQLFGDESAGGRPFSPSLCNSDFQIK